MNRTIPNQLIVTKRIRLEEATARLLKFYEKQNLTIEIDARIQSKLDYLLNV